MSSSCFTRSDGFQNTPARYLLWKQAHLMLHLPILAFLLAFYHHWLLVRIQSSISLKSHSFLAAKEGSDFPVSWPWAGHQTFCGNLNVIPRRQVIWIRYCVYIRAGHYLQWKINCNQKKPIPCSVILSLLTYLKCWLLIKTNAVRI